MRRHSWSLASMNTRRLASPVSASVFANSSNCRLAFSSFRVRSSTCCSSSCLCSIRRRIRTRNASRVAKVASTISTTTPRIRAHQVSYQNGRIVNLNRAGADTSLPGSHAWTSNTWRPEGNWARFRLRSPVHADHAVSAGSSRYRKRRACGSRRLAAVYRIWSERSPGGNCRPSVTVGNPGAETATTSTCTIEYGLPGGERLPTRSCPRAT